MVEDIRFDGKAGRPFAMFLRKDSERIIYIANYRFWRIMYKSDQTRFYRYLITSISHETLHAALVKISKTANVKIDRRRVFGDLLSQEYPIGLRIRIPE
jgi:hypothetical protein